ncbi:S-layer homology domain-containing protein [Paenibacillus sp. P25]|nr:S-layer homology domain-containing protein [Paenibacillus sp. P25]
MVKQYHSFIRLMSLVLAVAVLWGVLPAGIMNAAGTFSDVDAKRYAWAVPSIQSMAAKQVLTGYPDGTFRPDQTVSKAEWTAMVYRLFDKYRPNLNSKGMQKISYFTDLPESHWAYKPIGEIYNTSFSVGGYGLNRNGELAFRPEMQLTRLQLALMLYAFFDNRLIDRRISDNDACSLVATFKDIPVKTFANAADYASFAGSDGRYVADGLMSVETQDVYPALMLGTDRTDCRLGDDPLSNVEIKGLASLQASGIMTPTDDGYFRPTDRMTRAEAVTILDRIYRFLKKNYWLSDYSSIDLDSTSSGTAAGSTAASGGGTDSPFTYNPNSNVIAPNRGAG